MNGSTNRWPMQLNDAVRRLYPVMSAGKVVAELSKKFGVAVSRSAVIGKAHRLGISKLVYFRPADTFTVFGQPCSLIDVRGCRWPMTARPPHAFCNAPQLPGSAYCAAHDALSRRSSPG